MRHESSVSIDRPIDEVWAFMLDPFNIPRWGGRLAVRVTPPGPLALGSSLQQRIVFFGFEFVLRTVVTEWDPPHAMAHSTKDAGIFSFSARATLEPAAAGTKVVRIAEIEPEGMMKLVSPLVAPLLSRRMDAQTQNLKRLLEARRG